jgi:hypothetical protein
MSPFARSWFGILSGMVLGLALLAAVWVFSGGAEAGFLATQLRGGIAGPSAGQGR